MARTYSDVAEPRYVERAKVAENASSATYKTFPTTWNTTGTTAQFCASVNADASAVAGMAYLGELRCSDLPTGLVNVEAVVEVIEGTGTSNKVIHLVITSGNVQPYRWEYTYWNNGSNVSGWIAYQTKITVNPVLVGTESAAVGLEVDGTKYKIQAGIEYEEILAAKCDLLTMDLDGTSRQYRVIKMLSGSVAEVVGMANASDSQQFAASGQVYADSALDTYLNTTWYTALSESAKAAIVDKTFIQDSWYNDNSGNPDYSGYSGTTKPGSTSYTISLGSAMFGTEITRHVYALSVQDVLDYVLDMSITDGQLQNYNIWKMLWNDEVQHTGVDNYLWLRSANASLSSDAFYVDGTYGATLKLNVANARAVRPAFQIDLSKISFTKV